MIDTAEMRRLADDMAYADYLTWMDKAQAAIRTAADALDAERLARRQFAEKLADIIDSPYLDEPTLLRVASHRVSDMRTYLNQQEPLISRAQEAEKALDAAREERDTLRETLKGRANLHHGIEQELKVAREEIKRLSEKCDDRYWGE